jgi:hypothetical protein
MTSSSCITRASMDYWIRRKLPHIRRPGTNKSSRPVRDSDRRRAGAHRVRPDFVSRLGGPRSGRATCLVLREVLARAYASPVPLAFGDDVGAHRADGLPCIPRNDRTGAGLHGLGHRQFFRNQNHGHSRAVASQHVDETRAIKILRAVDDHDAAIFVTDDGHSRGRILTFQNHRV